ncbi:glycosyltransferase family 2 protein [Tsukamurella sputi]|uniref:Glycosyltransferase family 2 protein n=1 Tax=Tsukamurella sputi TaxID=2591848 RepID=A0A5C5RFQ5_9ACTN|nr:glycosyltransferase family 2 protein [Tsukamurella sputi]TWS21817.1 glycosyltransferase family 2 protein [Tsukamurella sputi]
MTQSQRRRLQLRTVGNQHRIRGRHGYLWISTPRLQELIQALADGEYNRTFTTHLHGYRIASGDYTLRLDHDELQDLLEALINRAETPTTAYSTQSETPCN